MVLGQWLNNNANWEWAGMSAAIHVHVWMQKEKKCGKRPKIRTLNCCYAADSSVEEMFVVGPMFPPSPTYTAAVIEKASTPAFWLGWGNFHYLWPNCINLKPTMKIKSLYCIFIFGQNFLRVEGFGSTAAVSCSKLHLLFLCALFLTPYTYI